MNEAIQNLVNRMIADYEGWQTTPRTEIQARMLDEYINGIEIAEGRKYIKVLTQNSVWGFIVATDEDAKFKKGDILMAAGYNAPARNKARGNVFDLENLRVQWTGANYL
jgi:aspartyl-tRNA synthetase